MAGLIRNLIGGKDQELLDAARFGKVEVIEKLVCKNAKASRQTASFGISWPVKTSTNVNCVDSNGYTPLHLAVLHGHKATVEMLLAAEALPSQPDNTGCTALHLAAWKGFSEICGLLLANEGVPINVQNSNGDTALNYAAQYGYDGVVDVLIQHSADPTFRNLKQESALDLAAQYGHVEVVSLLVDKFPYLSQRLIPNRSPLHLAAACGHRKIVEILLDADFDINTKTDNGTALHVAVTYCKPEIVSVLLERGTDLMGVDRNGHTAQDIAAQSAGGSNSKVSLVIQDYIQRLQDLQKAMIQDVQNVDYVRVEDIDQKPSPSPEEERPSPQPRSLDKTGSPKVEHLYARPNKRDRSQDKRMEEPEPDFGNELSPPPIPPRSESLLDEMAKHLPSIAGLVKTDTQVPFSPAPHQPLLIPPKNSPPQRQKEIAVNQDSWEIPGLPPGGKQRHNSGGEKSKPVTRERRTSEGSRPYFNVSQLGGPKRDYMNIGEVGGRDDLPPPKACSGESSSVHVSVTSLSASGENLSQPPRKTPPQKPKRSKPPASSKQSPHGSENRSPVPPRRDPQPEEPIMDYLPLRKPQDYMTMSEAKKEASEDYMRMAGVQKGPPRGSPGGPTEDYMKMLNVGKEGRDSRDDYMKMNKVESSEQTEYMRMSKSEEDDTYKDMYKILNLNRDRAMSDNRSSKSNNTDSKSDTRVNTTLSTSSTSSDDVLTSSSESGEFYTNEDVFTCSREVESEKSKRRDKDYQNMENIPNIPVPRRPNSVQPNTSEQKPPDLPVKKRSSHRRSVQKEQKRKSRYDNVENDETVVPIQTDSRDNNSNCDQNICDKNDSVVIEKTEDKCRLSDELAPANKRLSNGVHHAEDSPKHFGEGKLAKPPTLEFEKKRLIREDVPLTPTGYPQPATPDFPPPSPNTAMQGIQEKMADIDSKRSSRDMETITELVYLRDPSDQSSSSGNIPKVDTTSGAHDIPFADDVSSMSSSVDDLSGKKGSVDEGLTSGPAGDSADCHSSPVVLRRRSRQSYTQPPEGAAEMRRSTGSASSSSQEDLMREDELGPLAGLLRGSVVGRPRRVVSQIWDNVKHRKYLRAKKRQSLPTTGLTTFDPLMEKEEDVDKKMIDSISATRVPMTADTESEDDSADWAQIAGILSSYGEDISQFSDLSSIESEINRLFKGSSKVKCVGDWLEELNLGQYENTLVANGYDNTDFLGGKLIDDQDLEQIGIKNSEHRKQILDAARLLPEVKPIDPDNPPASVEQWLESLGLETYVDSFKSHDKDTMERVLLLWEVELHTVLDISAIGHRKRILASLGERQSPEKQYPSLKKRLDTQPSNSDSSSHLNVNLYKDYTGVKPLTSSEEDVKESSQNAFPPVDSSEDEEVFRENKGMSIRDDNNIHLRPPHQATITSPIKEWRHPPVMLIKGYCNYIAQYLGSTLVKELSGPSSTIEGISKLKKSADVIAKIPTIKLAISFRGVKFIDAKSERVICDHEIGNIFCACQDADSMNFFAYITRDNDNHYCHVFSVKDASLAREIILTLGEAFEVAYQMALKEKAQAGALEFDRQMSQSDVEPDSISISSKASISTV